LQQWTEIQQKHHQYLNSLERRRDNADLTAEESRLLAMTDDQTHDFMQDKLFIETGEDVEDIMLAWKFYKLN